MDKIRLNKQKIHDKANYCMRYEGCTPFFCNENDVSQHDLFIAEVIIQFFILIRIQQIKGVPKLNKSVTLTQNN